MSAALLSVLSVCFFHLFSFFSQRENRKWTICETVLQHVIFISSTTIYNVDMSFRAETKDIILPTNLQISLAFV